MKTYVLIKDNSIKPGIAPIEAEEKPTIAPNKGEWMELNDPGVPAYNHETQTYDVTGAKYYGKWKLTYTVRNLTPAELWKYPDYAYKVSINRLNIPDYSGLATMLLAQGLPTVTKSDGTVETYLNFIHPDHMTLINQTPDITLEENPW